MNFLIGFITVWACVLGGYVLHHGNLSVLWQPTEVLIIVGAAVGSFIIGTPGPLIKDVLKSLKYLFKGMPYKKDDYLELLTMLFAVAKTMRTKGMLEIEQHIENPHDSSLFSQYPGFHGNHHAVEFVCTYLRLLTAGVEDYYQMEELMDREIKMHEDHGDHISHTITTLGDAFPAIGIVAAVLGVIITMGSIDQPPEILGQLIGAALVGTFLGIFLAYGFVSPMGRYIGDYYKNDIEYLKVIKVAILAHIQGHSPAVALEFARNAISENYKPGFQESEEAFSGVTYFIHMRQSTTQRCGDYRYYTGLYLHRKIKATFLLFSDL